MKRGKIEIKSNGVFVCPSGETVWLTKHQIADLFGVFVSTVGNNIRSIYKSGLLQRENVVRQNKSANGTIAESYSFEMIVALAFRIRSEKAEVFRTWVIRFAVHKPVLWKLTQTGPILN
jgi:hypothetical protein